MPSQPGAQEHEKLVLNTSMQVPKNNKKKNFVVLDELQRERVADVPLFQHVVGLQGRLSN